MEELRERERSVVIIGNLSLLSANNKLYLDNKYRQFFNGNFSNSIITAPAQYSFLFDKVRINFLQNPVRQEGRMVCSYIDNNGIDSERYSNFLKFVGAVYTDLQQAVNIVGFNYKIDKDRTPQEENINNFFKNDFVNTISMDCVAITLAKNCEDYILNIIFSKAETISSHQQAWLADVNCEYRAEKINTNIFDNKHEKERREIIDNKIRILFADGSNE